ncbi:hypothetical protein BLNAU_18045 [Blattamonas nauphoetae]|uniref:Uncharacterized protein n=1 Tax=Blattamonas nauphoetae TaxID=2049346 RepID=A0ABQ9X630_9EUKA|nr:hypothetical protein BLNAU_18045 [Blattamonas nauphoetae]
MTTLASLSMIQPNNPLLACTEVLIAQHEVCFSGVSKRLFCPNIAVTEAQNGSEGSAKTLMKELWFEAERCGSATRLTGRGRGEEEGGEEGGRCIADSLHPAFRPLARQDAASEVLARMCVRGRSRAEDVVEEEGEQAQLLQCDLPNSLHSVDSGKGRNEGVRNKRRRVFEHTGDAGAQTPKEDAAMLDRSRKERPRTIRMGAIPPVAFVDVWFSFLLGCGCYSRNPTRPTPLCPPSAPTQHATQSAFLSFSLSLSTISHSSFPDLVAEHMPNTRVVDYLLTHVATLEDAVKKQREELQEHLKLREEVESVKAQMEFLVFAI